MKNRTSIPITGESRLMDTEELRAYTNLGRNNAMKLGEEIGAKVQIGRRVFMGQSKSRSIFQFINRSKLMQKNRNNPAHGKKSGKTKFQIESLLPVGKENAVTTAELVKRPVFDKYMNDLCKDRDGVIDESKKAVLQEYGGLLLSNVGVYRTKLCLVLWSLLGNTGKTQFIKLLSELLGEGKTVNIPIQNMNEASKFALGSVPGSRIISIGDQTSSEIKDSSIFKQLTGGDAVSFERKGKQPFNFIYPGGIIIACNNLPMFTDDKGGHLFERLCVVPCTNTIERERRDGALLDKMLQEKEAILNWFLEGLHRLIDNKFKITKSASCDLAMSEYREKMDTVYRYLSEFYVVTGNEEDMVSKPKFEEHYLKWCIENEYRSVNKQNIKERMEANGCPVSKARYQGKVGVMVYRNLKERDMGFCSITQEEYKQQDFPFS